MSMDRISGGYHRDGGFTLSGVLPTYSPAAVYSCTAVDHPVLSIICIPQGILHCCRSSHPSSAVCAALCAVSQCCLDHHSSLHHLSVCCLSVLSVQCCVLSHSSLHHLHCTVWIICTAVDHHVPASIICICTVSTVYITAVYHSIIFRKVTFYTPPTLYRMRSVG